MAATMNGRDNFTSHVKNWLSHRSELRSRIMPSAQIRSVARLARVPRSRQLSETGDADRYRTMLLKATSPGRENAR